MKRPPPSLQARALGWLAQREHSRAELRRKLLRVALQPAPGAADARRRSKSTPTTRRQPRSTQLLDWLQAQGAAQR